MTQVSEDKRPRIMLCSDSAAIDTGMGIAHRTIARKLYETGKFNIASFGWFWRSAVANNINWKFPWKQYSTNDNKHPYGHPSKWDYHKSYDDMVPEESFKDSALNKAIEEFKPNIVIVIGDQWMADFIYFLPTRHTFKLIHEFPIDGEPIPASWIRLIKKADVAVVMSNYASKICRDIDPYIPLEVIPRGIDTRLFRPVNKSKNELRKQFLNGTQDRFVVGVFDRFQDRKQIPRAIEGFAKFHSLHKVDDSDIYLHMDMNDSHSIQQRKTINGENGIVQRYGITHNVIINKNVIVEKGVSEETLVGLYNCMDVKLSTTQGEGWGLTTIEAMACGVPCIATNCTTMTEFLSESRGLLADVKTYITGMYNIERALVDTDSVAKCLELMYRSVEMRKRMGAKSREYVLQYDWNNVFPRWLSIVDKLLEKPRYELSKNPKGVAIQRDKQEINLVGALYENTGFSVATSGIARGLISYGHEVSIDAREGEPREGFTMNRDLDKYVLKQKYNDVEIINHMPDTCKEKLAKSRARVKIAYFPWELTEVKDEWIDLINRDCDAYWCNSNFVKNLFVSHGAHAAKISVIPNGVSINTSAEPDTMTTKKRYKFLMVGNLGDPRKNVVTLIQAYLNTFTSDDDVCLVLKSQPGHYGSDPTEICETLCRGRAKTPEIEVIHVDAQDLSGLYKACDCFVTASHAEGFCQPILDSLSVGMPIIAPSYGGYLDFVARGKFYPIKHTLQDANRCMAYIPGSKWCEIDYLDLTKTLRNCYETNITRDNVNYVKDYTWESAGKLMTDAIRIASMKTPKKRVYYNNFSVNMWNDDNRENIKRYAPDHIEFTDDYQDADLQILDIAKLADFNNIKCNNYIINFHCRGEYSEENIKDYLPYFKKAAAVYSHLDLQTELPELTNFVRGPWGTNHRKFYFLHKNVGKYIILNTGSVPETEGIYESVAAAQELGLNIFHTGPNLGIMIKSYNVSKNLLTVGQMRDAYTMCSYTSGMRRIEGFEKTVAEGLLCGSRPICFDTPLYRHCYGDLVEYVREGNGRETADDLVKIFKSEYREVTEKEREITKQTFAWVNVAPYYWNNISKIGGF